MEYKLASRSGGILNRSYYKRCVGIGYYNERLDARRSVDLPANRKLRIAKLAHSRDGLEIEDLSPASSVCRIARISASVSPVS